MKNLTSTLIALALFSVGAHAQQNAVGSRFLDQLSADGLKPISDGLYGERNADDESYVAFTPAGQRALLERLIELRDTQLRSSKNAPQGPTDLDRLIDALSAPELAGERYGDCNGAAASGPFHVVASASGGVFASASASNSSNPTIATTNTAYASASDTGGNTVDNNSTTANNVTASASVTAPNSRTACSTMTAATITCAGGSRPAIAAFATSTTSGRICQ